MSLQSAVSFLSFVFFLLSPSFHFPLFFFFVVVTFFFFFQLASEDSWMAVRQLCRHIATAQTVAPRCLSKLVQPPRPEQSRRRERIKNFKKVVMGLPYLHVTGDRSF